MILKFLFCISTILMYAANTNARPQTRILPKLACDCRLSEYAREEMQLGFEYLDMSYYLASDRVALYGFQKLFKHHWSTQLDNMHKVLKYGIKRGDEVKLFSIKAPKIRSNLNSTGPLHQVKIMIEKFIRDERILNDRLLKLMRCSSDLLFRKDHEKICKSRIEDDYDSNVDPMLANFIDEHFLPQKIERIKDLADLYRRLAHFDIHLTSKPHQHVIYPIGIHLIDKELGEKFS